MSWFSLDVRRIVNEICIQRGCCWCNNAYSPYNSSLLWVDSEVFEVGCGVHRKRNSAGKVAACRRLVDGDETRVQIWIAISEWL